MHLILVLKAMFQLTGVLNAEQISALGQIAVLNLN